ncbi:hypothetical protein TYRP_012488 [Tyrophagus putrescentiae]|nr:hypothetical protein TYRP_012488 [Tyrophagus putrescentiae]
MNVCSSAQKKRDLASLGLTKTPPTRASRAEERGPSLRAFLWIPSDAMLLFANKVSFDYVCLCSISLCASGGNGEMDSGLCVLMRAAQDPASLKTKSTVWTLAPSRGAQVARWSSAKVQDVKWAMVDDVG